MPSQAMYVEEMRSPLIAREAPTVITKWETSKWLIKSVLDKLREFDSATIANVIEVCSTCGRRNRGFMTREIKVRLPRSCRRWSASHRPRLAAHYAELPERQVPAVPDLISRFDELAGPPVIVLQNLDTERCRRQTSAMCSAIPSKHSAPPGLVTNGPGRDFVGIEAA